MPLELTLLTMLAIRVLCEGGDDLGPAKSSEGSLNMPLRGRERVCGGVRACVRCDLFVVRPTNRLTCGWPARLSLCRGGVMAVAAVVAAAAAAVEVGMDACRRGLTAQRRRPRMPHEHSAASWVSD